MIWPSADTRLSRANTRGASRRTWGQFAKSSSPIDQDAKLNRTKSFNEKLKHLGKETGLDEWGTIELLEKHRAFDGGSGETEEESRNIHAKHMRAMDQLVSEHGDKPKSWEPDNPYSLDKWETGDWESPEKAKSRGEWWYAHNEVYSKFRDELVESSELDHPTRTKHLQTVMKVLEWMPTKALNAMRDNVTGATFYKSLKDLTSAMVGKGMQSDGVIGGCWEGSRDSKEGKLHLDGGFSSPQSIDQRGIYSHEFGHVCDWHEGNQREEVTEFGTHYAGERAGSISDTLDWRKAFDAELSRGQLSRYGGTSRSEGFAEFSRLCWGTGQRPKGISDEYPMCYAVFQKHGLTK